MGTLALRNNAVRKACGNEIPLTPSPLGISNYDAFDLDETDDEYEGGPGRGQTIYSDFNIMNPVTGEPDDYDYLDASDGIIAQDLHDSPPPPPEDGLVETLREKERQGQSYFVRLGG